MFAIPTLADLTARARSAYRAYLPGSDAWLWPNNIYATAKVLAGMVFEVFGFADYIQRQKFALTADSENLDLHGAEFGVPRRPAGPGRGFVTFTATTAITIAPGAVVKRADDVEYIATVGGFSSLPGTVDVEVVSAGDGRNVNAEGGTPLAIVSGVTGSALAAVATAGIAGGTDVEDDESFRARILFRKRYPPHGGAASDYVMWAEAVPGVTQGRVYIERLWNGPGTVRVFFLMNDLYPNGIPPAGEVVRVADYIEAFRPAGASPTVAAPTPVPVNVQIGSLSPDTTAVREQVLAELRDVFLRRARVAGGDTVHGGMPFLATPATFSRSWITQAIANAAGEDSHILLAPLADTPLVAGQYPVLGNVTFTG